MALDAAFAERDSTDETLYLQIANEEAAALAAARPNDTFISVPFPFPAQGNGFAVVGFEALGPSSVPTRNIQPFVQPISPELIAPFVSPSPVPASVRGEAVLAEWLVNARGSVDSVRFTPTADVVYNAKLNAALRGTKFQAGMGPDSTAIGMWYGAVLVLNGPPGADLSERVVGPRTQSGTSRLPGPTFIPTQGPRVAWIPVLGIAASQDLTAKSPSGVGRLTQAPAPTGPFVAPSRVPFGQLVIECFVNEKGRVDSVRFKPTPDSLYNIRLESALRGVPFRPGVGSDGRPAGMWYKAILVF